MQATKFSKQVEQVTMMHDTVCNSTTCMSRDAQKQETLILLLGIFGAQQKQVCNIDS